MKLQKIPDWLLLTVPVLALAGYNLYMFLTGWSVPDWAILLLGLAGGFSAQLWFWRKGKSLLRYLPLILGLLFFLWGIRCFLFSPDWRHATLTGLLCGNGSIFFGAALAALTARLK